MSDVVIVGGGLAGLTCARRLQARGRACLVLDAGDAVGGRVRTNRVDGFQLDRGFQVLLTAYPAAQHWLDCDALLLRRFSSGARVWCEGAMQHVPRILVHYTAPAGCEARAGFSSVTTR